ncbi:hypothetical protein ACHWQZ_G003356 [Mnemiopsis leidyi]
MSDKHSSDESESEEPTEKEGLLDLAWERQQAKTFTAWCNSHLRKLGIHIDSVAQDFRSGVNLVKLLEVISGGEIARLETGKMRIHKVNNVKKALDFVASKGVNLIGIGAEEIVDGNLKMTLGMIWTIILRFAIQDISVEEMSAKEGLLLWCQKKTAPYKNVNVTNFHTSFKDGLAFCALIHRHRPDLIDYNHLRKENAVYNLQYAFEVAEKELDIPIMLDANDIASTMRPDERAIMTYVSSYYHAFASSQQASQAANRICKVLNVNQENETLMEDYEALASGLLEWIEHMIPWIDQMREQRASSISEVKARLEEFRTYRLTVKPPKTEEKGKLITDYNTLQTKLRLSNRPAFLPSEGKLINDIERAWDNLETTERGVEQHLMSELIRLQRLEHLFARFSQKCDSLAAWITETKAFFKKDNIAEADLNELLGKIKSDDAFDTDMGIHRERLDQIANLAQDMVQQGFSKAAEVAARSQAMNGLWENLLVARTKHREDLETARETQEKIDTMRLEFAKKANPFNNWLEGAREDLLDTFVCHSIEEVNSLVTAHEEFKACLPEFHQIFLDIQQLQQEIDVIATFGSNPYTNLEVDSLGTKWNELLQLIPQRDQLLQDALVKEKKKDELRKTFANHANWFANWTTEEQRKISESTMGPDLSLNEQLAYLAELLDEVEGYKPQYEELENLNKLIQNEVIFNNPYCKHTMESLNVSWEELHNSVARQKNAVENQILVRDSKGINEEQVKEMKSAFDHFDKNDDGRLDHFEFRACLVSLGYNVDTEEHLVNHNSDADRHSDFERVLQMVDPDMTGQVTFNAFMDFMTQEASDMDTAEQIIASFRVLAGDKRYITPEEIRRELPAHQAEYCIARMSPYEERLVMSRMQDN